VVTLQDVARQAGVSPMTVSNVINGKASVRPAARQRVLDAIEASGYRVNLFARALAGGRSRLISVFSPQLNKPYAAEVIQGAARAAEALGYDLVVMMLAEDSASDLSVMTRLSVGTLLIQPGLEGRGAHADLPNHSVSVDGPGERQLTVDNYGGSMLALEHLRGLGHSRIGFISGLESEPLLSAPGTPEVQARDDATERLRAYRTFMRAQALHIPEGYVQHGDYSKASGEVAARRLLDLKDPPTALFVAGDAMAVGAVHAAQDRGLWVPRDLSVVGFDDLPVAAAARPGLSTVRQPLGLMGEVAVRILVEQAEGREPEQVPPFATELVVRESSAAVGGLVFSRHRPAEQPGHEHESGSWLAPE
jgi:LacI family transcriptional regulator